MTERADVVIVGAGVMGAAAARSLARAGRNVVVCERFAVGHRHGSSHGTSRIFRFSYDDVRFVRMAQAALPRWRALEEEAGVPLLDVTGGFDVGAGVPGHAMALRTAGAEALELGGREARRRYPELRVGDDVPVLFQPDAGVLRAERAWRALIDVAIAHGAELREHCPVERLTVTTDEVEVELPGRTLLAGTVIVAAGPWSPPLLAGAGIDLPVRVTRETVAYFDMLPDRQPPPPVVEWGAPTLFALPAGEGRGGWGGGGLKAGEHHAGPEVDPDIEGEVDQAAVDRVAAWVAQRFPGVDPAPREAETCFYTSTADQLFVVERHGPLVVGSACSGHGFKFAPLIGDRLARLAMDGAAP